jgi:hypothetical protein
MIDLDHFFALIATLRGISELKRVGKRKKDVEYLRNCLYTYPHEVGEAFPEKR